MLEGSNYIALEKVLHFIEAFIARITDHERPVAKTNVHLQSIYLVADMLEGMGCRVLNEKEQTSVNSVKEILKMLVETPEEQCDYSPHTTSPISLIRQCTM